jgi:hypothetical protein
LALLILECQATQVQVNEYANLSEINNRRIQV